jgi:glutamine synthetase
MSVYLGEVLDHLVTDLIDAFNKEHPPEGTSPSTIRRKMLTQQSILNLGQSVGTMHRDRTDRNRTSPFAFTGNKFEFRAPGSSSEVGASCTILNIITAAAIRDMVAEIKAEIHKEGGKPQAAIKLVIGRTLKKHQRCIFNGDGYSQNWIEEASRRGLANCRETVAALHEYNNPKNVALFTSFSVLTKAEVFARSFIQFHAWTWQTVTEATALCDIVNTHIIPAGIKQQTDLARSIHSVQKISADFPLDEQKKLLKDLTGTLNTLITQNNQLMALLAHRTHGDTAEEGAKYVRDNIKPLTVTVRHAADHLEAMVADSFWTLPKYQEILFFK